MPGSAIPPPFSSSARCPPSFFSLSVSLRGQFRSRSESRNEFWKKLYHGCSEKPLLRDYVPSASWRPTIARQISFRSQVFERRGPTVPGYASPLLEVVVSHGLSPRIIHRLCALCVHRLRFFFFVFTRKPRGQVQPRDIWDPYRLSE